MADNPVVLLGESRPDSLFLSQMYDPDVDGADPTKSGKIIPRPGSLIIDEANAGNLYYAASVDPVTFKTTLKPASIVRTITDTSAVKLLSYGNDRFVVFFDDRVKPTKLAIDGKLLLFGSNLVEYRLYQIAEDGNKKVISLYVDADGKVLGDRIPLAAVNGLDGAMYCTNCHTLYPMKDGDTVYLEVFDNIGSQAVLLTMFMSRSVILNDLSSNTNPIMNFDATCLQMRGDEFYLHEKQDPSVLGITPFIDYADGSRETVPVDNVNCFLYGLDEVIPSYPGYRQQLTLKLFLNNRQVSPIVEGDGKHRFLVKTKWLTVVANTATYSGKISVIPVWNGAAGKYELRYFFYSNRRDKLYDVTPWVVLETPFDGTAYDQIQQLVYHVDLVNIFPVNTPIPYRQTTWLKLRQYAVFDRYELKDTENDPYVYGVEAAGIRRPTIHYDTTLGQYFIPSSVFENKEAFLQAFYYRARPPFNLDSEVSPVVPTHFTIRNIATGNTIITTPIETDQYHQAWNIVLNGPTNQLVDGNVLVEFLKLVNGTYQLLYGVPVDVFTSLTGYNTLQN